VAFLRRCIPLKFTAGANENGPDKCPRIAGAAHSVRRSFAGLLLLSGSVRRADFDIFVVAVPWDGVTFTYCGRPGPLELASGA